MTVLEVLFIVLVVIILYVYFGYSLLIILLSTIRPALKIHKADITPPISVIITAYNEEKVIKQKIENTLALEYPKDKIEIIVVSDGSKDSTNEIVKAFSEKGVKLFTLEINRGKSSAQNKAVAEANGEILFFTDANVMFKKDALRHIVSNFRDERVGCASGKVAYLNERETSVSEGEGIYWKYELSMREKESKVGNFAMGSGPIMAIRRNLFQPLDPNVGEDFVLPMRTAISGYRVIYEPEAISEEILYQNTPASMLKSKVRIINKDLRGLFLCRTILNPFRYPLYAWGLISHKLLRWLVPYFLIALFVVNLLLLDYHFYRLILALQIAFYLLAFAGYLWHKKTKLPFLVNLPFSFCLVNLSAFIGVLSFLMKRKTGSWEPVR